MKKVDRLKNMFENGQFRLALLGDDDFHLADYTWGTHDQLLVFYHLFNWLKKHDNPLIYSQIKDVFRKELTGNRKVSKIDQGLESLHLLRNYCIEANDQEQWPIEPEFFIDLITENIDQFSREEIDALNIRRDVDLLRGYLPGLPPNEKLYN